MLPTHEIQDYASATEERLQLEIDYCIHDLEIIKNLEGLTDLKMIIYQFLKKRLSDAENELERRYLLS